jgi:hypothetical protein
VQGQADVSPIASSHPDARYLAYYNVTVNNVKQEILRSVKNPLKRAGTSVIRDDRPYVGSAVGRPSVPKGRKPAEQVRAELAACSGSRGLFLNSAPHILGGVLEPKGHQPCIAIPLFLFIFGGQFWESFSGPA